MGGKYLLYQSVSHICGFFLETHTSSQPYFSMFDIHFEHFLTFTSSVLILSLPWTSFDIVIPLTFTWPWQLFDIHPTAHFHWPLHCLYMTDLDNLLTRDVNWLTCPCLHWPWPGPMANASIKAKKHWLHCGPSYTCTFEDYRTKGQNHYVRYLMNTQKQNKKKTFSPILVF